MDIIKKLFDFCCNSDYGIYKKMNKIFPTNSLADHLGSNISSIVYNPAITLAVITVIHLVIIIVIFPFYMISYMITVMGSWILLGMLIVYLCRFFARSLMFPGALLPVQRNVSKEILRGIASLVNTVAQTVQESSTRLHLCARAGNFCLFDITTQITVCVCMCICVCVCVCVSTVYLICNLQHSTQ
jgi:hypothetical protein